jgi:peptidoglycan/LPS O-acetylase OafA/YrhL
VFSEHINFGYIITKPRLRFMALLVITQLVLSAVQMHDDSFTPPLYYIHIPMYVGLAMLIGLELTAAMVASQRKRDVSMPLARLLAVVAFSVATIYYDTDVRYFRRTESYEDSTVRWTNTVWQLSLALWLWAFFESLIKALSTENASEEGAGMVRIQSAPTTA